MGNNKVEDLEILIRKWADDKGIPEKSTAVKQLKLTAEEVVEAIVEIEIQKKGMSGRSDVCSELGDILVTVINAIYLFDKSLTVNECLTVAYDKIKTRKGTMINGKFTKE